MSLFSWMRDIFGCRYLILFMGKKRPREEICLDAKKMRASLLIEVKKHFPNSSLLRVYWYDGLGKGNLPTQQHKCISCLDDMKMRYGTINSFGQQKGVDGLLMADLLVLAQNKAITSALLISGDADLAPGVNAAQTLGVRIHRLEISGPEASSPVLSEEVDQNSSWSMDEIRKFACQQKTMAMSSCENIKEIIPEIHTQSKIDEIAEDFVKKITDVDKNEITTNCSIPHEIDKRLLFHAKEELQRRLGDEEKKRLRFKVQQILGKND